MCFCHGCCGCMVHPMLHGMMYHDQHATCIARRYTWVALGCISAGVIMVQANDTWVSAVAGLSGLGLMLSVCDGFKCSTLCC
jgi:hypothetical protein